MNTRNFRAVLLALAVSAVGASGITACNTGTDPGETNVERGNIRDEGEMVGEEGDLVEAERDTMEQHYDHADHENHDDNTGEVIGDGAYDGEGDSGERDDVQQ